MIVDNTYNNLVFNRPTSVRHLFPFVATLICLTILFPYSPALISSSTQPVAPLFLLGLIFLVSLIYYRRDAIATKFIWYVLFLWACVLFQLLKSLQYPFSSLLLLKYFSAAIFFWFGYQFLSRERTNLITALVFIWALGASVQLLVPDIFSAIVSGQEVSEGRGVVGFAPEPSFMAIHMGLCFLYFLYMNLHREIGHRQFSVSIALIFYCLVLTQSATGLMILFLCVALLFFKAKRVAPVQLVFYFCVFIAGLYALSIVLSGTRASEMVLFFVSLDFLSDESFATRLYHNAIGLNVFLEGKLLGYSAVQFAQNNLQIFDSVPEFIRTISLVVDPNTNGKIHSLFANLAIDFGFFCLPFIIAAIIFIFFHSYSLSQGNLFFSLLLLLFFLILFMLPIPVGSPLFFSVLGLFARKRPTY